MALVVGTTLVVVPEGLILIMCAAQGQNACQACPRPWEEKERGGEGEIERSTN